MTFAEYIKASRARGDVLGALKALARAGDVPSFFSWYDFHSFVAFHGRRSAEAEAGGTHG